MNSKHLYRHELDKASFAHDAVCSDSKDLAKRTISDKILKDRNYEIDRNCKFDHRTIASMVYKFFDKKTRSRVSVNAERFNELYKLVIEKFKRRKIYARFNGNIRAADLAEMESLSFKNKNVKYLLCVVDVFTKYAWVKRLKNKKGKTVLNAMIEIVNEFNRKPNKLWVDQGREFCNRLIQEWLNNNDILMYLTQNESKSVIAVRFVRTLNAKIYKK